MTERADVVVVGGGVIGCAIAWALASRGIASPIATDMPGLVPYVMRGSILEASRTTDRSYDAPGSAGRLDQSATARSQSCPRGE